MAPSRTTVCETTQTAKKTNKIAFSTNPSQPITDAC